MKKGCIAPSPSIELNRSLRRLRLLAPCLVAVAWISFFGCSHGEPEVRRPNVLLITVDTLRADQVGAYASGAGYGESTTPNIDKLARDGVVFENATASIPVTKPAHLSILTSRYPRDHGVVNNRLSLTKEFESLPQVFRDAGWETAAFTATFLLGSDTGVARGFDVFNSPDRPSRDAPEVVPLAADWLRGRSASEQNSAPFFLWLHLFDPHMPYAPPPRYRQAKQSPIAKQLPIIDWPELGEVTSQTGGNLSREAFEHAMTLYTGEVSHLDSWIGVLLNDLENLGSLDDTIILFTADHGESFDHGIYFDHSNSLYESTIRVPFILRYPPVVSRGERSTDVVESLDIAPTLLALAGLKAPDSFAGRDLFAPHSGNELAAFIQHPFYPSGTVDRRTVKLQIVSSVMGKPVKPLVVTNQQTAIRTREWKYILTGDDGEELYNLTSDPGENRNLRDERPEVASKLRERLDRWMSEHPIQIDDPGPLNPELIENLRALGYLE